MSKLLLILMFVPLAVMGQIFKSANQQFVENAVKGSMFVIRLAYQLEDSVSGQRFGRYGSNVFGTSAALAVRTRDGVIFDSEALRPWSQDENFIKYQHTHIPVLSHISKIELGDSVWNKLNPALDSVDTLNSRLYTLCDSLNASDGFMMKQYDRPTEGWLVWLSNDSVIGKYGGRCEPDITTYKKTIEFAQDSVNYRVEQPHTNKQVWGGIFIVPEQIGIGVIQFNLAGIVLKAAESEGWELFMPAVRQEEELIQNQRDELTPLINNSPNKKNKKK